MLETIAIPILLKAVEFLFGEGSKILEERRERRKTQQVNEKGKSETPAPPTDTPKGTDAIRSKEAALSHPVAETAWAESEAKVRHLLSLLEIYTKNYYLAKEEYAKWGSALVPPIIVHNLTEAEDGIATTTRELQAILSKAYGKQVVAPEVSSA